MPAIRHTLVVHPGGGNERRGHDMMGMEKMFADERTAAMEEEDYVNTFFEFRKAFFLSVRMRGSSARGGKRKNPPGSRGYLVRKQGRG